MKEKWFMKKKHVVSFNLLTIGCAMFFTGCDKHLDDTIMKKIPSETNTSTAATRHVDCLHQRWYEGSELTKAEGASVGIDFVDILAFVGKNVASGAFGKAGGFGAELVIGLFIPDQTQAKLDEILDRLDDIQTSINTLSNTVKLANYDAAFREKETMYINLQSKTVDTWLTLQALDKNKTLSSEERISKRKDVVKKWGDSNINGAGSANYSTINFAKKIMSIAAEQKNYFQIYDEYALKYFGFEAESFAWRENCRDRDMTLLAIAFSLSNMYENLVSPDEVSSLAQTVSAMEKFSKTYKVDRSVYEAGNRNRCYIPELYGRWFYKYLEKMPYSWYSEYPNTNPDHSLKGFVSKLENYFTEDGSLLLSQAEIKYIYTFYNSRSTSKKSLDEILTSVGFIRRYTPGKQGRLVANGGFFYEEESFWNANYIIRAKAVSLTNKEWDSYSFWFGTMWSRPQKIPCARQWDTAPDKDTDFVGLVYSK